METRLYLLCYQFEALVVSQLSPEEFGAYMAVGLKRTNEGEEIFFEIDKDKVPADFNLQRVLDTKLEHDDGSPRRSKYVSSYRVLERLPLEAFGSLYLATRDGRVLQLDASDRAPENGRKANMFLELCPINPLVVSDLGIREFLDYMTTEDNPVGVPKLFFADLKLGLYGKDPIESLPYANMEHIQECLQAIRDPKKDSKTVSRRPEIRCLYRTIGRGFFVGNKKEGMKYYPFPSENELEESHHKWWRSASLG